MKDIKIPQVRVKETFLLPPELDRILTDLPARIMLDSRVKVTKTELIVGLLRLLKSAKIDTDRIQSIDDVMEQMKANIRGKI